MPPAHWSTLKQTLAGQLAGGVFDIWIEPIQALVDDGQRLVLGLPNRFSLNWVGQHYLQEMAQALELASGGQARLELEVAPPPQEKEREPAPSQPELPYRPDKLLAAKSAFNQAFTFEAFVCGPENEFARQAAQDLAGDEGGSLNAIYLQAGTGLGKSHLCQAAGIHRLQTRPQAKVLYLTAEEFTNQMVSAIKLGQADRFKERFRSRCDTMILEEIQFLSGKEKTQTELAYTLDALQNSGARLVFTGSRLPQQIPGLRQELSSRLSGGVVAPIGPPSFQTRVKILLKKARQIGTELPEEVAEMMAQAVSGDVRRLESALLGLVAKSRFSGRPIDAQLAREVLVAGRSPEATIDHLTELVGKHYQTSPEELTSRDRTKRVAIARMVFFYLCRLFTDESLAAIGRTCHRRHTTVLYALDRVEKALQRRCSLGRQVEYLIRLVREEESG